MIIFDLCCTQDHAFEAWFQSAGDFDKQLECGQLACPQCGSVDLRRVPSAVHVSTSKETAKFDTHSLPTEASAAPKPPKSNASIPPENLLATYQALISKIVESTDDVGSDFAEEARKMHYMETPLRSIRGEVTSSEFKSLHEEGIDVLRVSWPNKKDLN